MSTQPRETETGEPVGGAEIERPGSSRRRRLLRLAFIGLTWLAGASAMGFVLVALLSHLQVQPETLATLQVWATQIRHYGALVQCMVVAGIGIWWQAIVAWGARCGIVRPQEHAQVIALRPKVMASLIAYLLLIPVGPAALLRWLRA
ncbi:hypothetical protein AVMA1855_24015 [Acidovorax sp. SUPP1855]|uniref:hypothetical protein n=1 Tax=Acidovorax sp. SUPP1855 TaxID=431774 RepID=UPI0023DE320E|nr:hypothetical protein [Acidovorax sp. SUPP1855]GKS87277.1 hypothetical protein AVMA1855_24015 [Acidovorax sp. SUPP1855]